MNACECTLMRPSCAYATGAARRTSAYTLRAIALLAARSALMDGICVRAAWRLSRRVATDLRVGRGQSTEVAPFCRFGGAVADRPAWNAEPARGPRLFDCVLYARNGWRLRDPG